MPDQGFQMQPCAVCETYSVLAGLTEAGLCLECSVPDVRRDMIGADDQEIGDRVAGEYDQLPGNAPTDDDDTSAPLAFFTVCKVMFICGAILFWLVVAAHAALRLAEWAWRIS